MCTFAIGLGDVLQGFKTSFIILDTFWSVYIDDILSYKLF